MNKSLQFQYSRLKRIQTMDFPAIRKRLLEKVNYYCSYQYNVRRIAYALESHSFTLFPDRYAERPETGPSNLETKLFRQASGGPFEPYSISLINKAAVQLIGNPQTLLEIGCGTGMFSSVVAKQNRTIKITASEFDEKTLAWAQQHRSEPNLTFCRLSLTDCALDQFDLVVVLEVIEHIFDYPGFLSALTKVAPQAIISTPNKSRDPYSSIANTPEYHEHVREWTAGEFYWVLRCFYNNVELFTLPHFKQQVRQYTNDSSFVPALKNCSVLEREEPLIARCSSPRRT